LGAAGVVTDVDFSCSGTNGMRGVRHQNRSATSNTSSTKTNLRFFTG
jgi:hypothetical protein